MKSQLKFEQNRKVYYREFGRLIICNNLIEVKSNISENNFSYLGKIWTKKAMLLHGELYISQNGECYAIPKK